MVHTKIPSRKTVMRRHGRRRRPGRLYLLMHRFPVQPFLLAAAIFMAGVLSGVILKMGQADSAASGEPASPDEPVRVLPVHAIPEPAGEDGPTQTVPAPIAAGTWKLMLVNRWNPLPEDDSIETVTLKNGLQVDKRCYPDLQEMMDACRSDGLSPVICSAYRTWEAQERLYQNKVEKFLAQGYPQSEAETEAGKVVAVPGTGEHQLGLAVDIVDINNQLLDETQESTEVQKWLMEHSWEYGFILRYPNEKSEITGIIYEPWHYRYVGREDAEQIHTLGICLEEYLAGGN